MGLRHLYLLLALSLWAAPACHKADKTPVAVHPPLEIVAAAKPSSQPALPPAPASRPAAAHPDFDPCQALKYLASDELEGRGTETAGINLAAEFIANQFRDLQLRPLPGEDDYFQIFEMTTATGIDPNTSLAAEEPYILNEQFSPVSFSAEESFEAPAAFVGYGISNPDIHYDDYAEINARGKVVIAMRFEPHDAQGRSRFSRESWSDAAALGAKAQTAAKHGAVALLLVNPPTFHGGDDLMPLARRFMGERADIPVLQIKQSVADELLRAGGAADLQTLQRRIDETGKPHSIELNNVRVQGKVKIQRKTTVIKNVMAYLPGTGEGADEFVVIGAHYDHLGRGGRFTLGGKPGDIFNGADDNASGTAAMLELAERFALTGPHERSLIFIAFTAEELGLIGSNHFLQNAPIDLSRVVAMLNMDMVGRVKNNTLYIGGGGTAEGFGAILKEADEQSPLILKSIGEGGLGPSDHMAFALKKIPVLFFFSGVHPDYHRPGDDAEKINFQGLEQVIDLAADVIEELMTMPKSRYVDAADASSYRMRGNSGNGRRVVLGVVPNYEDQEIEGVRIGGTIPNSPAAAAGLRAEDVLIQFNQKKLQSLYDLSDALAGAKAGDKVRLIILRDGKKIEVEAILAERKD